MNIAAENYSFPKVSVLMTVYNRENFLREAIESVLKSSYQNFELIIVDDQSVDHSAAIAISYAAQDDKIKFFVNGKNLGDYANRNQAASYATGEFIMNVDSDDMIYPESIEKAVNAMVSTDAALFGMTSRLKKVKHLLFMNAEDAIQHHFFKDPFLMTGPGGTIIRRTFFNLIGGYPEKYGPANDMYFNLKAAAKGGVLLLPDEIVFYRMHEGQEINNQFGYLYHNYNYLNDALNELNLPITESQKIYLSLKNKRRFTTNIFSFLFRTFDFKKTRYAITKAKFGFRDLYQGIFH